MTPNSDTSKKGVLDFDSDGSSGGETEKEKRRGKSPDGVTLLRKAEKVDWSFGFQAFLWSPDLPSRQGGGLPQSLNLSEESTPETSHGHWPDKMIFSFVFSFCFFFLADWREEGGGGPLGQHGSHWDF